MAWKKITRKKIRSSYLKVPKSTGPNRIALAEYKARARSIGYQPDYLDKLIMAMEELLPSEHFVATNNRIGPELLERYRDVKPSLIRDDKTKNPDKVVNGIKYVLRDPAPPRIRVIQMWEEWQNRNAGRMQGSTVYHQYNAYRTDGETLTVCFAGQQSFFLLENYASMRLARSCMYSTERARLLVSNKQWGRIHWIKTVHLPSPEDEEVTP